VPFSPSNSIPASVKLIPIFLYVLYRFLISSSC
jgi:hypothetical protein